MSMFRRVSIACIRGYQRSISPLLSGNCRFFPTCSEYTIEAISRYGVFRGWGRGLWRILRCHPFHSGGYDPLN